MHRSVLIIAAGAAIVVGAGSADARRAAEDRQYTATYNAERRVYCIRFFSDTLNDPRPNTAASTCMTRARWAQRSIFIEHRRSNAEIAAR
ncbi:hypothetical protein NF699_09650 [Sphingomonadaceae bacterium OTU29LAMAA1]|nr:hypothetical protein NF699_09650 [Sphingomonadaceae bacterium OTU29LAMAA1]